MKQLDFKQRLYEKMIIGGIRIPMNCLESWFMLCYPIFTFRWGNWFSNIAWESHLVGEQRITFLPTRYIVIYILPCCLHPCMQKWIYKKRRYTTYFIVYLALLHPLFCVRDGAIAWISLTWKCCSTWCLSWRILIVHKYLFDFGLQLWQVFNECNVFSWHCSS